MTADERKVATGLYRLLNSACRGGVTPIDDQASRETLTAFVCDQRTAVHDVLLTENLCYDEPSSVWKQCTAEERRNLALNEKYGKWMLEDGPHPSGAKPAPAYIRGKWAWTGVTDFAFANLDSFKRASCHDAQPGFNADDTVEGWFVHNSSGEPTLVIPWTNDVALTAQVNADDESEIATMIAVRC